MLNKVQLIGHVGHDLELRATPRGTAVVSMSIATTRAWKGDGGKRQAQTEWHCVELWGTAAENATKVLVRGSLLYVEGRLRTRTWEDAAGKHSRTEVVAQSWQVLSRPAGTVREVEAGFGAGEAEEAEEVA